MMSDPPKINRTAIRNKADRLLNDVLVRSERSLFHVNWIMRSSDDWISPRSRHTLLRPGKQPIHRARAAKGGWLTRVAAASWHSRRDSELLGITTGFAIPVGNAMLPRRVAGRESMTQRQRSVFASGTRRGRVRWSTASWCRKASIQTEARRANAATFGGRGGARAVPA